jgi:hypothetical protein
MAAKPLDPIKAESIVADWRTGEYSQQDLADRHKVSKGAVNKLCKGVEQDTAAIVAAGVLYKQGLAAHDDRNVTAVTNIVDERTKHIQFFTSAAVINVRKAMEEPCEGQVGYRMRAETILKGKETVLGKSPDTAIQINNTALPRTINVIAGRS